VRINVENLVQKINKEVSASKSTVFTCQATLSYGSVIGSVGIRVSTIWFVRQRGDFLFLAGDE
jgi:hypothetical protein